HDAYSAKKVGAKPTGIAGAPFGLRVSAGNESFEAMTKARSELLFVDRFSGNADPLTGDFSGVVKGGRLFSNGQDVGAVSETMIAGNVLALAQQILAVANQAENISGQYWCPAILIDGVSVTGA